MHQQCGFHDISPKARLRDAVKSASNKHANVLEREDDTMTVPRVRTASTRYSIRHDRPNEASGIQKSDPSDGADDNGHSTKRRRVAPVSHTMILRNNDVNLLLHHPVLILIQVMIRAFFL